jgi:ADP-ribose pyrophosphatase YjhB (NUDIX family)
MAKDGLRPVFLRAARRMLRRPRPAWPGPPGPFARRVPCGASALVRDARGHVLLVRQTYVRPPRWSPPGGWVGRGETIQQAAAREAYEEVGLAVAVGRPLAVDIGDFGALSVLFDCRVVGDPSLRLSDEVDRAAFFAPDALPPMPEHARRWLLDGLAASAVGA